MNDGFLHKYFLNNSGKGLLKLFHYFDIYERHFERFRGKSPVMLEIGVFNGGSLPMWKAYFGPGTKIIGVDIDPRCKDYEAEDIEIFIGSQDDPDTIAQIIDRYPNIDIVLDDGSHIMKHMIASFNLLYDHVNANGLYVVEDTHTCYWDSHDGGVGREGSFMEMVKAKLDEINAYHTNGQTEITPFTRSTDSITCYDSVVVFERRTQSHRQQVSTQAM